ncbi:MAG: GNAT family N-acetyltransferase [Pirellulaceae bacterium]
MSATAESRKSGKPATIATAARTSQRSRAGRPSEGVAKTARTSISKVSVSPTHGTPPASQFRPVPARSGDHHLIRQLLVTIFHAPSQAEFQAQLEDPLYEPTDRLLVRRGSQVIGHSRLVQREMHFGNQQLAIANVTDVAVLPEYRGQGCGSELLRAVEDRMVDEQAVIGTLRTRQPAFFLSRGWCIAARHSYSVARASDILSFLRESDLSRPDPLRPRIAPLNIRLWRHVEQAALMRLYAENTAGSYGPLVRTEPYWRWLVNRRAYDRIYVAIEGPDRLELDDTIAPIVGYAVMRDTSIVELMTSPRHPQAASQLLARACRDAIEHDLHHVRLDAPPQHPLHGAFTAARGSRHFHEADQGEVFLFRLYEPLALLNRLSDELHLRARQAGLGLPSELGLCVDGEKHGLMLRPRSAKLASGKLGRSYLECSSIVLAQLLLGHLDIAAAAKAGRLSVSTRVAMQTAKALFPRLPFWRPPWDDMRA